MRALVLTVRFMLELAMLAAIAIGLAQMTGPGALGWAAGVLALLAAAGLWGAFVAPKAPRRFSRWTRLALEAALFIVAAALLAGAGRQPAAAVLLAVYVIDTALMQALRIDERDFVR